MKSKIIIATVLLGLLAIFCYAQTQPIPPLIMRFLDLTDVDEATYVAQAGKYIKVNAGETAVEFGTPAGAGDLLADGTVPLTANWDVGNFDITLKSLTGDGTIEGATITEGGVAVYNDNEIDEFSEINAIVADKTLVNEEDAAIWDALGTFNLGASFKNGAVAAGFINIYEDSDDGGNYTKIQTVAQGGNITLSLPPDDGDAGEQLQTDGSGVLTWEAAGGGGDPVLVNTVAIADAAGVDLTNGTGITITLNAGASPDTATFAATLGTSISDAEVDDNITIDLATLATTVTITDNEATAENNPIVFVAGGDLDGGDLGLETDGDFHYNPSTGTETAPEFVGGGAGLTSIDAITGDSATAFFDAGTIEHEWGGLQANISGYTGLIAITGADTTAEIDSLDELEGQLADVTRIVSEAVMPVASADPDVDAAGELSVDTDGANEPNDVVLRSIDGGNTPLQIALAQQQKSFQATIIKPNDLADATRDLCPIWSNETGMSFVITKIEAWSDTDDTTLNVEVYDSIFGNNATVDALEIAGDGTANYYVTETTITANTIAANYIIALDFDDTDDPGWVKISICGYFLSDVD